jgi:hypothetical protein
MAQLSYLVTEICAALEIYYSGRTGGQYHKTAFILCDDYTELTSKLFLLADNRKWSDKKDEHRFKTYHDIQLDVQAVFRAKRLGELAQVERLHAAMQARRDRRNDFFHSTHLLDLTVNQRECVEAFCDLMDYGKLLFGTGWESEVSSRDQMETLHTFLLLEKRSFCDATIMPKVNSILKDWPRRDKDKTVSRKGTQFAEYPEDLHLRLCVIWGGRELRDKLKALLQP